MFENLLSAFPFKKNGRKTIVNTIAGFEKTIETIDSAVESNKAEKAMHEQAIKNSSNEISDIEKHNEKAMKLKTNLANLLN